MRSIGHVIGGFVISALQFFTFLHQPPKHQSFCSGFWSLCKCYWQDNQPRVHFDCITDLIALIALTVLLIVLLWLYCLIALLWLYCSGRIADRIALIVLVFGSVLCFWYHSDYLFVEVQAVQDIIHLSDESRTCILQIVFQLACAQVFLLEWQRLNDT